MGNYMIYLLDSNEESQAIIIYADRETVEELGKVAASLMDCMYNGYSCLEDFIK